MAYLGMLPKGNRKKKIVLKDNEKLVTANKGQRDGRVNTYKGKENYKNYLNTNWWKQRKIDYYNKHKKICFCCGDKSTNLHHRTYSRLLKEKDSDLIPLCGYCHSEVHKMIAMGRAKLKNSHHLLKEMYKTLNKINK